MVVVGVETNFKIWVSENFCLPVISKSPSFDCAFQSVNRVFRRKLEEGWPGGRGCWPGTGGAGGVARHCFGSFATSGVKKRSLFFCDFTDFKVTSLVGSERLTDHWREMGDTHLETSFS